jgi:two-component system sensor histidine kinase FlrB
VGTPFFTTRAGGTGLGVVIARRIARQHGGELAFDSRPGAGTTARLRLPAVAARASS